MTKKLYRSPDVCKLAGITYRQLDYWVARGVLNPTYKHKSPRGTGNPRYWDSAEVDVVIICAAVSKQIPGQGEKIKVLTQVAEAVRQKPSRLRACTGSASSTLTPTHRLGSSTAPFSDVRRLLSR